MILFAAAGTGMGLLAMLVVVLYGVARALEILRHGEGARRLALGALVAVSSLTAGVGYLWALGTASAEMLHRARQMRTLADMKTTVFAVTIWSSDQMAPTGDPGQVEAPSAASGSAKLESTEVVRAATTPEEGFRSLSFDGGDVPPPISHAELEALLVPDYASDLPEVDGWDRRFELRLDRENHRFWMRSGGRDGSYEDGPYVRGSFDRSDLDRDVVWVEGEFWRWPAAPGRGSG